MKFKILGQYPREGKRWQIGEETARELEKKGYLEIVDGIVKKAIYPQDELEKINYIPFWSHLNAENVGTAKIGKEILNSIMNEATGFDTVKPPKLIEELIKHLHKNSIVLDSFAGSGTTAHAVLNLNKKDGGNRKFILVEMMDYAEKITAERVKRVIAGYGEGKKQVEGVGGGFDFYEIGATLMKYGLIQKGIPTDKIRRYIWYTETHTPLLTDENAGDFLGIFNQTAYYFYYREDKATTLDEKFLSNIKEKAEVYVIYADRSLIDDEELKARHIVFKKIPRDIAKL